MIIRYPLTVLTITAFLMAGGAALAGGMPSDEGPEVVLDEFSYGDSLDDDTITAIIKSMTPQPVNFVVPVEDTQTTMITLVKDAPAPQLQITQLPSALLSPEDEWRRDHR